MKSMSSNNTPVFIVGWPRSGSTLLAKMLAAHPALCCGPETHFFSKIKSGALEESLASREWIDATAGLISRLELTGQSVLGLYGYTNESFRAELAKNERTVHGVLSALYGNLLRRQSAERVVEKTPNHILCCDRIRQHFPDSPIIRIVRDPRDSSYSMGKLSWLPKDPVYCSLLWERWYRQSKPFFAEDTKTITIRYEDLVENPESVLKQVTSFIGEEYSNLMIDYHVSYDTVATPEETWKCDVSSRIDMSSAYRWKREYAQDADMEKVTRILSKALLFFNYNECDDLESLELEQFDALDLRSVEAAVRACELFRDNKEIVVFYGTMPSGFKRSILGYNFSSLIQFVIDGFGLRGARLKFVRLK